MGAMRQQPWWFPRFGHRPQAQQPLPRAWVRHHRKGLSWLAYAVLAFLGIFLLPQVAVGFPLFLCLQLVGHLLAYALLAFPIEVLLDLMLAVVTVAHIGQHILLPAANLLLLVIKSTCQACLGSRCEYRQYCANVASARKLCKEHLIAGSELATNGYLIGASRRATQVLLTRMAFLLCYAPKAAPALAFGVVTFLTRCLASWTELSIPVLHVELHFGASAVAFCLAFNWFLEYFTKLKKWEELKVLNNRYTVKIRDELGNVKGDCLVTGLKQEGSEPCTFYQVSKEHLTPCTPSFEPRQPVSSEAPISIKPSRSTLPGISGRNPNPRSIPMPKVQVETLKPLRKDALLERAGAGRFKLFQPHVRNQARFQQLACLVISLLCLLDFPATVSAAGSSSPSGSLDVLTSAAVLGVAATSAGTAAAAMYSRVKNVNVVIASPKSPYIPKPSDDKANQSDSDTPIGAQAHTRKKVRRANASGKARASTTLKSSGSEKGEQTFQSVTRQLDRCYHCQLFNSDHAVLSALTGISVYVPHLAHILISCKFKQENSYLVLNERG